MITKTVVAGLLAAGCLGAAAGGAYIAVRQNAAGGASAQAIPAPAAAASPLAAVPVSETEAIVTPLAAPSAPEAPLAKREPEPEPESAAAPPARARRRAVRPVAPAASAERAPETRPKTPARTERPAPVVSRPEAAAAPPAEPAAARVIESEPAGPAFPSAPEPSVVERAVYDPVPPVREREFVQVVVPAASVIGLHVETSLSSDRTQVEDRVDARVTRDVLADGRVVIPAGARVIGSVVVVERGGKIKERARLGVRFHTLVFADGAELPIRTDPVYREGESPSAESAKKIGGAAVGGAILGAIIGGGKGAMIGGAAGAAGGTAATMAGGRNAATLPSGTALTVRLSEPLTIDIEKRAP